MYISQLLPKGQGSKTALLASIIEPDGRNFDKNDEYLVNKVPLAHKNLINEYKERTYRNHSHVPQVNIIQNSDFYVCVHMEKYKNFDSRDLIKIPFNKRAKLLADVLRGVSFLSEHYGYFYLTSKMLSYQADGQINVWINQDYFSNKAQYAINHGRFSQEIFVADFKETFGGNFQEMKEFRKAKNINSLLKILNRGDDIYQSLLLSEPISKESLIYRDQALKFSNVITPSSGGNFQEERRLHRGLKHTESLHNIVINVNSESYEEYQEKQKKLTRTLSSPSSIKQTSFNIPHKNKGNDRSGYGSLTSQNLPRINFTYSSKQAWKKKQSNESQNEGNYLKSIKIRQTDEESSFRQSSKEFLKVSFPYTTTHSFSPLASFGSINLNSECLQDPQRQNENKKADHAKIETAMQEIGEMEMQFQNLFESNLISAEEELENLQVIMQEFENILQG